MNEQIWIWQLIGKYFLSDVNEFINRMPVFFSVSDTKFGF